MILYAKIVKRKQNFIIYKKLIIINNNFKSLKLIKMIKEINRQIQSFG